MIMNKSNKSVKSWETVNLSKSTVSTAVMNHLESLGYQVNRKRGCHLVDCGGFRVDDIIDLGGVVAVVRK